MRTETEPLLVQVQAVTAAATPLGEVPVEVVRLERKRSVVVAQARDRWLTASRCSSSLPTSGESGCWPGWPVRRKQGVELSHAELDGEVAAVLTVTAADRRGRASVRTAGRPPGGHQAGARRRPGQRPGRAVARQLRATPTRRASGRRLLESLDARPPAHRAPATRRPSMHLVDPAALRERQGEDCVPIRDLPKKFYPRPGPRDRARPGHQARPGLGGLPVGAARRPVVPRLPPLGVRAVRPSTEAGASARSHDFPAIVERQL